MIQLPLYIEGIIIGILLSDGWITFASSPSGGARGSYGSPGRAVLSLRPSEKTNKNA